MSNYEYLIVGGGMTANAAAKAIRSVDDSGTIAIVGSEEDPPYKRPPLTKQLWKGKPIDSIWMKTTELGVDMILGRTVVSLDLANKKVTDDTGVEYGFGKLLLACGASPRTLPFGGSAIIYYRTVADYRRLALLAGRDGKFVVIGGGFTGSEIAAALAMNGKPVTMVFPEPTIGHRAFPASLAQYVTDYYRGKGVELLTGQVPLKIEQSGDDIHVVTENGKDLQALAVIAGLGVTPNVELAQNAGLPVDNGIVVDEDLTCGHPDVYAAGDVANFHSVLLDRRMRVEHEDNALKMGKAAGLAMAGHGEPFRYQPMFYSDMFELGYEAVGQLDATMETVEDWKEPYKEGVVYYLKEGRVRGVLLWNVWEKVDAAKALIAEPGPFTPADLAGRITS